MSTKPVYSETICCGHKRCPTVAIFDDGSMTISDQIAGAHVTIAFAPDQAARLRALLSTSQTPTANGESHESP